MLALEVLLTLLLLLVCSFGPGFFLVRRLRWTPMEKLCGSVGASLALCYLFFTAVYLLTPNGIAVSRMVLAGFSASSLACVILARRDVARLLHNLRVRQTLKGFSFLLVWAFLILTMIRNYSGANWFGDWLEHFQRSLFFLHHFPANSPIVFGYQLPARPPAMNELAAFFLAQIADRFELFQTIFAFLNLLMFLPCCLIMPALAGSRRTFVLPLTLLFAVNPAVMQHVTYSWTKAFTVFFVILSFCFYLAGMRKNDDKRILAAFLAMSMGMLVHYSAGPYAVFLGAHYLLRSWWKRPRARRLRELAFIVAVCGALLATWFAWSVAVYGVRTTGTSNTSVRGAQRDKGNWIVRTASNLLDSIVPAVLRFDPVAEGLARQGAIPSWRDKVFVFYEANAIFGMGLIGGPLVVVLLYRGLFRKGRSAPERSFWLAMIPTCMVLGIASTSERDPRGLAHITLLSLEIAGLALLAATFPWRRRVLSLVLAGCLIDFSCGVLLQVYVESLENSAQRTVFAGLNAVGGKPNDYPATPYSFAGVAWDNWYLKHRYALNRDGLEKLGDHLPERVTIGKAQMQESLAEDETFWHGWYARNGGSVNFLGDHFAVESGWPVILQIGLLFLLLACLMRTVASRSIVELRRIRWKHPAPP
ncbi:MAG TPA: hypothetical protein VN749_19995 [Candidatus Eisenbacteria bacterium]|nr:hypothetical protein [Candidatus Eisenbacteria bacterium]